MDDDAEENDRIGGPQDQGLPHREAQRRASWLGALAQTGFSQWRGGVIEFGRFAALSRQRRGERRPETFAFLG